MDINVDQLLKLHSKKETSSEGTNKKKWRMAEDTVKATKIIVMYYKDGDSLRTPSAKKTTRMTITDDDNDIKRLKNRIR